jgi:hypothetical protein
MVKRFALIEGFLGTALLLFLSVSKDALAQRFCTVRRPA